MNDSKAQLPHLSVTEFWRWRLILAHRVHIPTIELPVDFRVRAAGHKPDLRSQTRIVNGSTCQQHMFKFVSRFCN